MQNDDCSLIAVIASEAKQSISHKERMDCFVASLLAITGIARSSLLKRADGKIAQPQIRVAAFFPEPEQGPVQRLPQQIVSLADGDADAFAEIAALHEPPAGE